MSDPDNTISSKDVALCIEVLDRLAAKSELLTELSDDQRIALLRAAGRVSRPSKQEILKRRRDVTRHRRKLAKQKEKSILATTGIRQARSNKVFVAPQRLLTDGSQSAQKLPSPRNCYVCKKQFTYLHFFYDSMCQSCAELNYSKRFQTADMNGQVALITGARLKIGYQAALIMLRAGSSVVVTTRFPVDAARRYAQEEDFDQWGSRLHIHGLDLRHLPSVEIFANFVAQTYPRLDILINNAAQTVRRPPGFYKHLVPDETQPLEALPEPIQALLAHHQRHKRQLGDGDEEAMVAWRDQRVPGMGLRESARLSQIPYAMDQSLLSEEVFPVGQLDADLQQVDLRKTNSWRLIMGEVDPAEMMEVQLINSMAPFILNNSLVPFMKQENTGQKHIVNVTAMEGKFHRFKKAARHPHTNMAKAALNMMTHTAAGELAEHGIYMNAVDTGWVTDEDPAELAIFKREAHAFEPQLDIVDGAARVCDPFIDGIKTGKHWCGKFLKDYFPIDW